MIMWDYLRSRVTLWVILGALGVAGGLIFLLAAIFFLAPLPAHPDLPAAEITVIPAPSLTPVQPTASTSGGTPTPTGQLVGGIGVGMFVQISGTGGDGLRLRAGPGTTNEPRFLGYEAEVFRVKDGPKLADGLTWWFLEAPYDPNRSGWAASQYLAVVAPPKQ
jgi:hypothetical protein